MIKKYKVSGELGKYFCIEYEPDGFFEKETGAKWPFQTYEFAKVCADLFNRLESEWNLNRIALDSYSGCNIVANTNCFQFRPEPNSEWICHMFGSNGEGFSWVPRKGLEPNWFWRKMQYLCFGNKWVKNK